MRWLATFGLILTAAGLCAEDARPSLSVRISQGNIEVSDLPDASKALLKDWGDDDERWDKAVSVRLKTGNKDAPPLTGVCRFVADRVRFTPKYPLQPGLTYTVEVHLDSLAQAVRADVQVPKKVLTPTSTVTQIYPTAEVLPENHLRFYVTFSAPMSIGEAYERIRLLDADGKTVEAPFLELAEELWNEDRTRLTLLIHPGRIKRGLRSFEEAGPVLFEGRKYALVVGAAWPDGEGAPLKAEVRKAFTVGAANTQPLDSRQWKLSRPSPGSRDPLTVEFPRPLDRFLLERLMSIVGPDKRTVPGTISVGERETRWTFTPDSAWPASATLVVDAALEDPCGNRIGRAFDLDLNNPKQAAARNADQKVHEFPIGFQAAKHRGQ